MWRLRQEEIARCVDRGVRAISFPENVVHFGLPSFYTDHWDPVWRICEETGTAVCMHIATAGNLEQFRGSPEAPDDVYLTVALTADSASSLLNLIFSPVCTKFPGLKIVFSESGVGWLPYALEVADLVWDRHHGSEDRPSDVWRRNMFVCQVKESIGLRLLNLIGADKVLWELDYPHPDTLWPHAQGHTTAVFEAAGVSDEEAEMICYQNAEQLFRWTPAQMPEPAAV